MGDYNSSERRYRRRWGHGLLLLVYLSDSMEGGKVMTGYLGEPREGVREGNKKRKEEREGAAIVSALIVSARSGRFYFILNPPSSFSLSYLHCYHCTVGTTTQEGVGVCGNKKKQGERERRGKSPQIGTHSSFQTHSKKLCNSI